MDLRRGFTAIHTGKSRHDLIYLEERMVRVLSSEVVCKRFLELVSGKQIEKLTYLGAKSGNNHQLDDFSVRVEADLHNGQRMAAFIQMPQKGYPMLEKKAWYFQSLMDAKHFEDGMEETDAFPDCYVIYLSSYDFFGLKTASYSKEILIQDAERKEECFRRHVIFLTSDFKNPNVPEELAEFLDYIGTGDEFFDPKFPLTMAAMQADDAF